MLGEAVGRMHKMLCSAKRKIVLGAAPAAQPRQNKGLGGKILFQRPKSGITDKNFFTSWQVSCMSHGDIAGSRTGGFSTTVFGRLNPLFLDSRENQPFPFHPHFWLTQAGL